ncbi:hypothetical protein P0F65_22665 [Sphingomonas sp. I4]
MRDAEGRLQSVPSVDRTDRHGQPDLLRVQKCRLERIIVRIGRTHGYYVRPFLLDEVLVARVDLKADREAELLLAHCITLEQAVPAETLPRLQAELDRMAACLGFEAVRTGTVVYQG